MKENKILWTISTCVILLFVTNCTKDIDIPFPDTEPAVVVDGRIVLGENPFVFLTQTRSFNEALDPASLQGLFVNDAIVNVSNGTDTVQLEEICTADIPPDQLDIVAEAFGITVEDLLALSYCIYFDTDFAMVGEANKTYTLDVELADGSGLTASTRIDPPIQLDSVWYELWANEDSLGFIYALISDPPNVKNAYRWEAQRINSYPETNTIKDFDYIAPLGSGFEDKFFDGLTFEFFYNRGVIVNSGKEDDNNEEAGFFKNGDTVAIRLSSITQETYDYILVSDDQLTTNGSPFAVPTNLPTNVDGGFGIWAGYGPSYDTVICVP